MEALTPASPDSLPPLAAMVVDDPFWRYSIGTAGEDLARREHPPVPAADHAPYRGLLAGDRRGALV
jgi:hypothetical protein